MNLRITRVVAVALCLVLSGCGVGPVIVRSEAMSYDDALEDMTNKLLVLNILRARDKAPLHFAEIGSIRVAIQQNASVGLQEPIGPPHLASGPRNTMTGNVSLQLAPSFELTNLVTKDFTTGIASPIDPKFVKYWLDRGLDRRIVLLLFFSSVDIVSRDDTGHTSTIHIANAPREAIDRIRQLAGPANPDAAMRCDLQSDFQRYLKLINSLSTFFAHAYVERRRVVDHVALDATKDLKTLQDVASADPKKLQWEAENGAYALYTLSPEQKIALCVGRGRDNAAVVNTGRGDTGDGRACYQSVVDLNSEKSWGAEPPDLPRSHTRWTDTTHPSPFCAEYNRYIEMVSNPAQVPSGQLRLQTRSVGEIIQFLGDLLDYQDELVAYLSAHPGVELRLNNPVTFGYCNDEKPNQSPGCDDIFFTLQREPCNPRFTVDYRGQSYGVGAYDPDREAGCAAPILRGRTAGAKDHSLEVLAVVHQLVDLNKSATEIRATPSVQVLP